MTKGQPLSVIVPPLPARCKRNVAKLVLNVDDLEQGRGERAQESTGSAALRPPLGVVLVNVRLAAAARC